MTDAKYTGCAPNWFRKNQFGLTVISVTQENTNYCKIGLTDYNIQTEVVHGT